MFGVSQTTAEVCFIFPDWNMLSIRFLHLHSRHAVTGDRHTICEVELITVVKFEGVEGQTLKIGSTPLTTEEAGLSNDSFFVLLTVGEEALFRSALHCKTAGYTVRDALSLRTVTNLL